MNYQEELNRQLAGEGIGIRGAVRPEWTTILTPDAVRFVATLTRRFNPTRKELLALREARQARLDAGENPDFLPETRHSRGRLADRALPARPRRPTRRNHGPVERKMVINALNSGAKVFMADFEDANAPTWENCVQGQLNLYDAVRRTIEYASPDGKQYRLNDQTAVLCVRPRGWHLPEKHLWVDGEPAPGALMDFGLYFYHNAHELIRRHGAPISTCPSWRAIWRRACGTGVPLRAGAAWRPARDDSRHRAD